MNLLVAEVRAVGLAEVRAVGLAEVRAVGLAETCLTDLGRRCCRTYEPVPAGLGVLDGLVARPVLYGRRRAGRGA
jgi:hypothetical protein